LKILHLSKFYPPDPGGLEHVVATLAEGGAAAGHDVRVVCAQGSRWKGQAAKEPVVTDRKGVTVVRAPAYGVLWSQPVAPRYLLAARWKCDVLYIHRPHPMADLAAATLERGNTVVFHHSDVQRQRRARIFYQPLSRRVAATARAVVVATASHLEHSQDLGKAAAANARVIPYGVDTERFTVDPTGARPEVFDSFAPGPVGFFVGRLVSYKGLDVMLRAMVGTSLCMVITGDGPVREALERDIASLGLKGQVVLTGSIPEADLPRYHQAADYFVLPSNSPAEMFGIVMAEAMACGRPVVSTLLTTGVREVNQDGVTGLQVPPNDAEALKAAMQRLSGDEALRRRLGAAGRARVEELFSLDSMISAHLALCQEIAAG
jgi:rhamnosyl/mannosyltransferase